MLELRSLGSSLKDDMSLVVQTTNIGRLCIQEGDRPNRSLERHFQVEIQLELNK